MWPQLALHHGNVHMTAWERPTQHFTASAALQGRGWPARIMLHDTRLSRILTAAVSLQIPTIGDPEEATGDYLSGIVGVRIATPFFGTGFNFCIGERQLGQGVYNQVQCTHWVPLASGVVCEAQGLVSMSASLQEQRCITPSLHSACMRGVTADDLDAFACRPLFWQFSKGRHCHSKRCCMAPA